jgi:hypothetical protein
VLRSAEFLSALDLRAHVPGEWVLLSGLDYRSAAGRMYHVPARFITDLASIPGVFQPAIDRNGKSRRAAVLHDWLYCLRQGTRAEADALFLEALQAEGVNWFIRRAMWLAVRAGGWRYWDKRTGVTHEDFVRGPLDAGII